MKKRLSSLLLALCCTVCPVSSAFAVEPSSEQPVHQETNVSLSDEEIFSSVFNQTKTEVYSRYTDQTYLIPPGYAVTCGIDVSSWDGNINWTKVKNAGIDFAMIQVGKRYPDTEALSGYALHEDSRFIQNIEGALDAGLDIGVYVTSQAVTREEAIEEANFVLDRVRTYDIQLPIAAALTFYAGGRLEQAGLSQEEMTQNALAFCNTIRDAGCEPMLYSSIFSLENQYNADQLSHAAQIWIYNYTQDVQYDGDYQYWQYSNKGTVDGIRQAVNCNFHLHQETPPPEEKPVPSHHFADVSSSAWYANAVNYVFANHLMVGTSETLFSPSLPLTRTMMAQILYSFSGTPAVSYTDTFTDIQDGRWYTNAVMWASENKMMEGYGDHTFGVNDAITREQLVSVLYRFSQSNQIDVSALADLSDYTDANAVSSYAVKPMQWAVANHIVSGRTATTLVPRGTTTRAECAQILTQYLTGIAASLMSST